MEPFADIDEFLRLCEDVSSQAIPMIIILGIAVIVYCLSSEKRD